MIFPRFRLIPDDTYAFPYLKQTTSRRRFHRNKKMTIMEFIRAMEEFERFMSSKNKKPDEKKDDKEKAHRFTLLETIGLCMFIGPVVGFAYLYMFQAFLQRVETLVK